MSSDLDNNSISNIDWRQVIKKEARGINGEDLGEVKEAGSTYIMTEKGLLNKEQYLIPIELVKSFDNDVLTFVITEDEAKTYLSGQAKEERQEKESSGQSLPAEDFSFEYPDISDNTSTEETIPLIEENLEVTKRIEEERIKIIKEPLRETKTVELQLMHEEISIERRPAGSSGGNSIISSDSSTATDGPVQSKTETIILLKREEPIIKKTPYVKEEVVIRKKPVTETRTISEQVTSERITSNEEIV